MKFKMINGDHPFKKAVPGAFVQYRVRKRHGGRVAFFNFPLAKQMGLIPKDHPEKLNSELCEVILDTFSIQIINEYDQIHNIEFPKEDIKPNKYMATRYLQIQHPDRKGRTSGDGRSIWNGFITNNGTTWDISSCGTGATRLSPACAINKKFYKTGDPRVCYGCGCAEEDEGLNTLFMSEVFKKNNIETEQVLAIIEFKKNSINVRTHKNLLRPSHFLNHLKQANYKRLKNIVNYHIERQMQNGDWTNIPENETERYKFFLDQISTTFAKTAATFEDEYIFCWIDWDGDNLLMNGGIIDYGSVRQFGLFHHEYRYDDIQRFSTSIKEQKEKTKYILQSFIQIVDFLITRKKKNIKKFVNHPVLKEFDTLFEFYKNKNILYKIGFTPTQTQYLLQHHISDIRKFKKTFSYFEKAKSKKGIEEVPDGINWNAIFCMRDILREFPQIYLSREKFLTNNEFIKIIRSKYTKASDLKKNIYREKQIKRFQKEYLKLVDHVCKGLKLSNSAVLLDITQRSAIINKFDRITGDSVVNIVSMVMEQRPKVGADELMEILHRFLNYQTFDPDKKAEKIKPAPKRQLHILTEIMDTIRYFREGL